MVSAPSSFDRILDPLRRLADRPVLLFLVLLTANALARPYAGFTHDARLYAVQVLNRVDPGSFRDDLFFKFGSQDSYSLFSFLVAPLVAVLGLQAAFFGLYLLFNGLFILALQRLVTALVREPALAVLSLLFLMVTPLHFGGMNIFEVHESFLTPRLMANALVLLGLERLLAGQRLVSLLLLLGAVGLHPLMAQGGVLIWLGVIAWSSLPRWAFLSLLSVAVVAGLTVVTVEPLGLTLFRAMDDDWHDAIRLVSGCNFPDEWSGYDWLNIVIGLTLLIGSAWELRQEDPTRARLLVAVAVVGGAGLLGTVVGSQSHYALLFQAQPYRTLWIVKALQVPLTFWMASRLRQRGTLLAHGCAVGLVTVLWLSDELWPAVCLPLFLLPLFMLLCRGVETTPLRADWFDRSLLLSLMFGCLAWSVYKLWLFRGFASQLLLVTDALWLGQIVLRILGPMFWLLVLFGLITWTLSRRRKLLPPATLLVLLLLVQLGCFLARQLPAYRQTTRYEGELADVARFLQERHSGRTRPTVYSALGRVDFLWIDLGVKSYYDPVQVVGCLFNRGTFQEGRRRALLVRGFEADRIRGYQGLMDEDCKRKLAVFLEADLDRLEPTRADVERLCLAEDVDFLLLTQRFPGLVTASFGPLHLYDCRQIRLVFQGRATPTETVAQASQRQPEDVSSDAAQIGMNR